MGKKDNQTMPENKPLEPSREVSLVQPEEKKEPIHQVPEESVAKPKKVIVLYPTVILLILISVVAGYLGYQNYQLRKQLNEQIIQTPAPQMSQETPVPTPDPTTGWEVYSNSSYGFSIKHPSTLIPRQNTTQNIINSIDFVKNLNDKLSDYKIEKNIITSWMGKNVREEIIDIDKVPATISLWVHCDSQIAEEQEKCNEDLSLSNYDSAILRIYFEKDNDKWYITTRLWKKGEKETDSEINNLKTFLSTFKFIDGDAEKVKECYDGLGCDGPPPCMANPASQFCECMGGKGSTKENEDGQYGICTINGEELDEWEYFRQMNPEDNTYSSTN